MSDPINGSACDFDREAAKLEEKLPEEIEHLIRKMEEAGKNAEPEDGIGGLLARLYPDKKDGEWEEECMEACLKLQELIRERTQLLLSTIGRPVVVPASMVGAGIVYFCVKKDISPLITGGAITANITGAIHALRKSIAKYFDLKQKIVVQRNLVAAYRKAYGERIELPLATAGLSSEHQWLVV